MGHNTGTGTETETGTETASATSSGCSLAQQREESTPSNAAAVVAR